MSYNRIIIQGKDSPTRAFVELIRSNDFKFMLAGRLIVDNSYTEDEALDHVEEIIDHLRVEDYYTKETIELEPYEVTIFEDIKEQKAIEELL